jgi:hypothetical protein
MNKLMQKLLILLVGTGIGTAYAKHNVYIKVASTVDYNFDIYAKFKDNKSLHLYLERKGNEAVLLGNLNELMFDTCSLQTPRLQGAYAFKDLPKMLVDADKAKAALNPNKDFLLTINAVGGRVVTAWDVKGEWIDSSNLTTPIKIINASDWHLKIDYMQKEPGALCEMTDVFMNKEDKKKVNFIELGDSPFLTDMSLLGKFSSAGSWSDLVTNDMDSTQFNLKAQIEKAKSLVKDWGEETLAIIIKHVGHSKISSLIGRKWDVVVKVVSQDASTADIAKAETVVATPVNNQGQGQAQGQGQGQTQSAPGMEVSVTNNSDWDIEISYTDANGGAQKKKVAAYSAADKAAQKPGAKVMVANIDDIKNLQLQGLSALGFVGKSVAYPAQTLILDKITQSTDQAVQLQYKNKNDYTINVVIDKVGRLQQAEWKMAVMARNTTTNAQVNIMPIISQQPQAPQQPPVNNQGQGQGQTQSAPGMEVSVINKTNWEVEVTYKDKGQAAQTKKLAQFQAGNKTDEPGNEQENNKVVLTNIDDITDLKFVPGGMTFSYNAQSKLEELKTKEADKHKNHRNDYHVIITIDHIPQKNILASWKVKYQVLRKKTNVIYNPEVVLLNTGDEEIEFEYTMDGKTAKVKVPGKAQDGTISQTVLADARKITKLGALQDAFMDDLTDALLAYDQLPSTVQAKKTIALEFAFFPGGLIFGNDTIHCGGHTFIDAGKQVPSTTLTVTRPGRKAPEPKAEVLPALTKAGDHQIAIRNRTGKEITVNYQIGTNNYQEMVAPGKNGTLEQIKDLRGLVFSAKGHGNYVASLLEEARAQLDTKKPQYIVFDVSHMGASQHTWVVRVYINSYGAMNKGVIPVTKHDLTKKYGGKIKQQ